MNDNSKCIDEFRFPELPIQIQLKRFTSSIQTYAFSGKIISDDDLYVVINSNLDGQLEIYRVKCENSSEFCNSLTGTISCAPFDAEIFPSTPTTRFRNCSLCGEKLEDEALLVVGKNELYAHPSCGETVATEISSFLERNSDQVISHQI